MSKRKMKGREEDEDKIKVMGQFVWFGLILATFHYNIITQQELQIFFRDIFKLLPGQVLC